MHTLPNTLTRSTVVALADALGLANIEVVALENNQPDRQEPEFTRDAGTYV
jgi:hypothetical protein